VTVEVFDTLGRRIAVLVDGPLPAGPHRTMWAPDQQPSGLYLVRLSTGETVISRSFLVVDR
jgi:hypothetical protein